MERWCSLPLVFVIIAVTDAGSIIFPGQLDHAEGDTCSTHTGASGTCFRSCEHSSTLREPRKCGILDSNFLYCCNTNLGVAPQPFMDIATPVMGFQCGRNTKNAFLLPLFDSYGNVLRPTKITPNNTEETPAFRKRREVNTPSLVGGINAVKNAWPWMALIGRSDKFGVKWFCGGALINEQWVLSAGHCFSREKVEVVRLGEHNYEDDFDFADHETYDVAKTVFYPDYNPPEAYHDLALLKLASKVTLKEHISPVCLPWGKKSNEDITGQQTTLTGWGDTEFRGFPSSILQEVNLTVFPSTQCDDGYSSLPHYQSTWPRGIGESILCVGDPAGGRDSCQGDSGGPLVSQDARQRFVLAGVVSKGYGCGDKNYPGLYANLRYPPYLAWIKKVAFGTQ